MKDVDLEITTCDAGNDSSPHRPKQENNDDCSQCLKKPEDPTNWPRWRKWSIVSCVAVMYMLANFGTIIIVPAVPIILSHFQVSGNLYQPLIVSIWELGEGVGSFVVGPLSELYGRNVVYHGGNILFILCSVAAALSHNVSMLVAFRFINGMAVTSLTLAPSIIGDLFVQEERGAAMAVAIALPLIGPCVAPIVGGFVNSALGWRWTIWIMAIAVGSVSLLSLAVFKETYRFKIQQQSRKSTEKKQDRGDGNHNIPSSSSHPSAPRDTILKSIVRPARILFSSPVVLVTSLYTALTYGISYLILTTLAEIMQKTYGFGEGPVGITFLGRAIGNIVGLCVYGLVSDRYVKHRREMEGESKPEHRLPLMIFGTAMLPIGLLLYGWPADKHVHWIVPLIGTGIIGFSMLLTKLPTENYLVDAFDEQGVSASALSANATLCALFGAFFPLAGPSLNHSLGLGWGNSLLAFLSLIFLPLFTLLWLHGEGFRKLGWGYLRRTTTTANLTEG
ncbi:major facilitator superfamily domain-containing protein [Aspergillus pseudonomiae]|uniref:Major facilitator superfamily domain-containing protein n=1 Tax=Aspergillus pseudonomiae TaxID=1506151 RepID=A0A5N6IEZ2_9EURO|nr:major facilitator superfamily domain-containing protein [Aspergillus pseudonomiae]KAB8264379.1 major facilitator superfamily domain-containing protein [Aspergillus pseudonomiae]KAE8409230.1 major facilitator superfamily domain-containing protein [Aspergillus pseudonomiae]